MIKDIIYFARVNKNAIIPHKKDEDAGYDCFPCFNEEHVIIKPFNSQLIPLGIASAFSNDYMMLLEERGSTGIKNIKRSCGVIDSGFRNQWFACIYNGNNKPLLITKETSESVLLSLKNDYIVHNYNKAICQALLLHVPKVKKCEISYEELLKIDSKRGLSALGSTDKKVC